MNLKHDRHLYEFGPFRIDTRERLLLRKGVRVPLTEKGFDTLVLLVSHSGHLMTKEELMAKVWPDAFVEENNIDKSISAIRQALGEKASAPEYIETVRGRGYRFLAQVSEMSDGDEPSSSNHELQTQSVDRELSNPAIGDANPVPRPRTFKRVSLILFFGMIAVGLSITIYSWLSNRTQPASATTALPGSIAVLPFKPLVADGRDESLELGMADSLITKLFSVRAISVRPISAVRGYVSLDQDPVAAGKELGVDAVLEGSIQRAGDRVRVTVRLVRILDSRTLWAKEFDEKFTDIFEVQDAISERVTRSLSARLTGEDERHLAKRYTENAEAYQLYVRGRYYWNKRTEEAARKSIGYFEQAVALDPDYALAYSGLADAYWNLSYFDPSGNGGQLLPQARAMALKALALDEALSEAHTSLGAVKEIYAWDFIGAEVEYKRALELNPNYASAHHRYAMFLTRMGRIDEAHEEFRLALGLEPLSLIINADAGRPFYRSRDYESAARQYRKTIEIDANFARAHSLLAHCYTQMGKYDEALAEAQKAAALSDPTSHSSGAPRVDYQFGYICAKAGRVRDARQVLVQLEGLPDRRDTQPYFRTLTYAALGDKQRTLAILEKLYEVRYLELLGLKGDPAWDDLRGDPRFQDFLRRIGLTP